MGIDQWVLTGVALLAGLAVYLAKSEAHPDAPPIAPPPERAPPEHEVKTALAELRSTLVNIREELERQHDHHDEELQAIGRKLTRIEGQLDRIEANRRLEDAIGAIYRQQKEG